MRSSARHCRIRRPQRGGGFSLIELVAVMVIIAILAAVAAPALSNVGQTRASMAAKQLLRDLTFARQRALATGTRTWVTFDASVHSWSILAENPAAPGRASAAVLNDMATGRPFTQRLNAEAFAGVQLTAVTADGGAEIGFNWLGQPLNAAETPLATQASVTLTGGHQVIVVPETGYARHVTP